MRYLSFNLPSTSVVKIAGNPLDNDVLDQLVPKLLRVFGYRYPDTFKQAEVYNLLLGIIRLDQHDELCFSEAQSLVRLRKWLLRVESNWSSASPIHIVLNLNEGVSLTLINQQLLVSN